MCISNKCSGDAETAEGKPQFEQPRTGVHRGNKQPPNLRGLNGKGLFRTHAACSLCFWGLCCAGDRFGGKEVVAKHHLALIGIPVEWP